MKKFLTGIFLVMALVLTVGCSALNNDATDTTTPTDDTTPTENGTDDTVTDDTEEEAVE